MKVQCDSCGFKAVSTRAENRIQELINRNRALENTIARITVEHTAIKDELQKLLRGRYAHNARCPIFSGYPCACGAV